MGSAIAIDFALAYPDRIRSLIVVGPWVNGLATPHAQQLFADLALIREARARAGRAAAMDAWMNSPFFRATARDSAAGARFRAIVEDYSFWHFNHRDHGRLLEPTAVDRTAEIQVSTLVITAEHDIPACIDAAELLGGTIARVRTVIMPGAGHLVQMEAADRFNEIVLGFLGTVQREPPRNGVVTSEPGVQLHYRILGGGADTVVIPGAASWLRHVTPLIRAHTLILYDPRSRGVSADLTADPIGMRHEIDDLEAVRRHFGLSRLSLIGWSYLGAMVALYAIRHPENVERLVMVSPLPPPREPSRDQHQSDVGARGDSALDWRLAELQHAELQHAGARTVRIRALVVRGERDSMPVASSREWVANLGDARLLVVPGAGHRPHVEAPTQFFDGVSWFLSGEWPEEARRVERSP
jgi:pimeloyl-ACP methyl ester carboxylesterase